MNTLIAVDEDIKSSQVYIGSLILKKVVKQPEGKISFFDLSDYLRTELKVLHYRQYMFALLFLRSLGLIDFSSPYIYRVDTK